MSRQLPGGENPFQTGLRPSPFNQLPVQEVIDRLGEPVIWLREMPTPHVQPGRFTLPDEKADAKGYFHTYPEEIQVDTERSTPHWRSGRRVYTKQGPVSEILRARVFRREDYGGSIDLNVSDIGENWFEYENPEVPDQYQILIDYKIKTARTVTVEFTQDADGKILDLRSHPDLITDQEGNFQNVLVGVGDVWRFTGPDSLEPVEQCTHDFSKIYVPQACAAGTRYRLTLTLFDTLRVAYRHLDSRSAEARGVKVVAGDLEMVTSPFMRIAEGDLFIFTKTIQTAKETTHKSSGFRLNRHPVNSIESCLAVTADGRTEGVDPAAIQIDGFQRLILPAEYRTASVVYNYHPQYRAKPQLEAAGLANRLQPPIWHLTRDQTNILLN